jgi:hypothetical protein
MSKEEAMDRLQTRSGLFGGLLLATLALPLASGCSILPFIAYLYQGLATPAEFDQLKGKRVAVICRPVASLQYQSSGVSRELAQAVADLLQKNVPKINVIDQEDIDKWEDENNWEEYAQIGKALNAEMVVGIDLDQFSLMQGQTLYQGRASVDVAVYDMSRSSHRPVFQKALPQQMFPPNSPIPAADRSLSEFRTQFVRQLAEQVARHFYDHDATKDFASDNAAYAK